MKLHDRDDGTEYLVVSNVHLQIHVCQQSWLVEIVSMIGYGATTNQTRFFHKRIFNQAVNFLDRSSIDERSLSYSGVHSIAQTNTGHGNIQLFDEGIVDGGVDEKPVATNASLSGVAEFRSHSALNRDIQVSRIEDDKRGVATQLERNA